MFEEFNHFFQEDVLYDVYVDDEIFIEAYSKKEEHRVKKFLKENKFEEDPDATTAEEKRKGYRRGTIETDIPDEKGGKRRIKFEVSPHPSDMAHVKKREDDDSEHKITMSKKMISRKPAISNFAFKHEEGHAAIHLDKTGKYVMEMKELDKILTRLLHKMLTNKADTLNEHDSNIEEFMADKYANEHNRYKQKTGKLTMSGEYLDKSYDIKTSQAVKGLTSLLSTDSYIKKLLKQDMNHYTRMFAVEQVNSEEKELRERIRHTRKLISKCRETLVTFEGLLTSAIDMCNRGKAELKADEKRLSDKYKRIRDVEKTVCDVLNSYAKDLNNELIEARENGRVLTKKEKQQKVRNMYSKIHDMFALSVNERAYSKYIASSGDNENYSEKIKEDLRFYKLMIIRDKESIKAEEKFINEYGTWVANSKKNIEELKNEIKQYEEDLNKIYEMENSGMSLKDLKKSEIGKKCINQVKFRAKSECDRNNRPAEDDLSTIVRVLMCLPKDERDRFAKQVHDTSVMFAKLERELDLKEAAKVQESYVDDDDTSGTSDFDTCIDNDPDDCYCESSVVFDKGQQIKVDVSELPFDTVYHGSIKNISMFDDKRTVFVTPSIAMASIFAGRPDIYKLREIRQMYHVKSPDINLQYLEWSDPKTLVMKQPLKTVHVIMQGAPEITDHYKYRQAGYIYAFNIKDPAIRDHVYKSTAMGSNEYVIKGIAPVPIEKIPIKIDVDVTGAELPERFKQEETLPTSGDFAQYAQYADLDSARGPMQSIHMRPATQADTENMYNWEIESIHPDLQTKPNVQELIRKDVQESIKDTQMIMDGDKTIGMFTACMIDGGEWRYIGEIYLIPEYRGKGIGTSILKNEIDKFDKIRLQVATTNTGAIKLYESLGFKIVKEVDGQMYLMEYDATKGLVQEAKLPAKKRNKLPDSDFALVYVDQYGDKVRKYPINDEAHVRAAARMFPKGVPLKYKKEVANKILHRAHKYDIDTSGWNSINAAVGK